MVHNRYICSKKRLYLFSTVLTQYLHVLSSHWWFEFEYQTNYKGSHILSNSTNWHKEYVKSSISWSLYVSFSAVTSEPVFDVCNSCRGCVEYINEFLWCKIYKKNGKFLVNRGHVGWVTGADGTLLYF